MRPDERHRYLLESWLEFREALETRRDLKPLLFDPVTGLPTTPLLFPRFQTLLEERGEVAVLRLNIMMYSRIEEVHGRQALDDIMRETAMALEAITGTDLRDSDVIAELVIAGDSFVVVLSPPRNLPTMNPADLDAIAVRVQTRVRELLSTSLGPSLLAAFGCYAGTAVIVPENGVPLERLVLDGLERALADALTRSAEDDAARAAELEEIVDRELVSVRVRPVLRLADMEVVGYQAVARGPEGTAFERPDKLARAAHDPDAVLRLERLCRKKMVDAARDLPEGRVLFMRLEPEAVGDRAQRSILLATLFTDLALQPDSVVLQLPERAALEDFSEFRSILGYVRALGFGVMLDDAGAGFGSLQSLAEVRPQWVKADASLVRGLEADEVRRDLLAGLLLFSRQCGANLVAEGIETEAQLAALREMGVPYGQGPLFGGEAEPFPQDGALADNDTREER